jgi:thymidylate synthase
MRYDLSQSFPLITTNEVFWKRVAKELSWILRGETNAQLLSDKEVKICGGNASRKFLDKMSLTEREEWDLGPI